MHVDGAQVAFLGEVLGDVLCHVLRWLRALVVKELLLSLHKCRLLGVVGGIRTACKYAVGLHLRYVNGKLRGRAIRPFCFHGFGLCRCFRDF